MAEMKKPCGHPAHPEDGNIGIVKPGAPHVARGDDVRAHLDEPGWFLGKFCKFGFPVPSGFKEYMWVKVGSVTGRQLQGVLKNTPIHALVQNEDDVIFTTDEIVDVYEEPHVPV